MSALTELLIRRIGETGPISVAAFMETCLFHPEHGYYTTAPVFGRAGDFITAPDISQMFGELLGLCLAQSWQDQGSPDPAVLAELGPGRGTLMADVLRATAAVPGFGGARRVHLVEASPKLCEVQRSALPGQVTDWHRHIGALPDAPLFLIANEFLDALPIRQLVRDTDGWRERMIADVDGALVFTLSQVHPAEILPHRVQDTRPGDVVELCPALPTIIAEIAERIMRHGGAAIFIDYGDWRSRGDTFQALRDHRPTDPLDAPGRADLTAHVDFEAIADAAGRTGVAVTGMVTQGEFLERLGITARAQMLARGLQSDPEHLKTHIAAHRRLTHPQEMGSLFKVIALHRPDAPPPPGFTP